MRNPYAFSHMAGQQAPIPNGYTDTIRQVALRRTNLDEASLDKALDPFSMTEPNPNISASG